MINNNKFMIIIIAHCFDIVDTATYPLRLIFGPNESSGRLQVLRNGVWGRVCVTNNDFTVSAGNVACKQLGYEGIMQVCLLLH